MAPQNDNCNMNCCEDDCLEAVFEVPQDCGISAIFQLNSYITVDTEEYFLEKYIYPLQDDLEGEIERALNAEEDLAQDLSYLEEKVDLIDVDIENIQEELSKKVETVTGDSLIEVTREGNSISIKSRTYEYEQGVASSIWEITHNLGKNPSVNVIDSANETQVPNEIIYNNLNSMTIKFLAPFKGKAFLN